MKKLVSFAMTCLVLTACQQADKAMAGQKNETGINGPVLTEAEAMKYAGVYAGSYVCANGENGITLSIDTAVDMIGGEAGLAKVDGRLWFYDIMSNQGHPSGAFVVSGTVNAAGELNVTPGGWISEIPANWGAAGVSGRFDLSGDQAALTGKPTGPGTSACEMFTLMRLDGLKAR